MTKTESAARNMNEKKEKISVCDETEIEALKIAERGDSIMHLRQP